MNYSAIRKVFRLDKISINFKFNLINISVIKTNFGYYYQFKMKEIW